MKSFGDYSLFICKIQRNERKGSALLGNLRTISNNGDSSNIRYPMDSHKRVATVLSIAVNVIIRLKCSCRLIKADIKK